MNRLTKLAATEFELDQLSEDLKVTLMELSAAAEKANEILNKAKSTEVYSEFYDKTMDSFKNIKDLNSLAQWSERAANTSSAY